MRASSRGADEQLNQKKLIDRIHGGATPSTRGRERDSDLERIKVKSVVKPSHRLLRARVETHWETRDPQKTNNKNNECPSWVHRICVKLS